MQRRKCALCKVVFWLKLTRVDRGLTSIDFGHAYEPGFIIYYEGCL